MTTGRINQVTILKPSLAEAVDDKVVRFAKFVWFPRAKQTLWPVRPRNGAFM